MTQFKVLDHTRKVKPRRYLVQAKHYGEWCDHSSFWFKQSAFSTARTIQFLGPVRVLDTFS